MNRQYVKSQREDSTTVWHIIAYSLLVLLALDWALVPVVVSATERSSRFDGGAADVFSADATAGQPTSDNNSGDYNAARQQELVPLSAGKYNLWLTIGDNDGYGYGVVDGDTLPYSDDPTYNWLFDNRSAAEKADPYARHTDYQSFSQSDFTLRFTFDPAMFTSFDTAWLYVDVSGLQQNQWADAGIGPTRLYVDNIEIPGFATIQNQGAWGSGVFVYGVSTNLISDGVLDARFDMQFSSQFPYFDPFSLDYVRLIVSGNIAPPSVPVLISPANGATIQDNYPEFAWSGNGFIYSLQWDVNQDFGDPYNAYPSDTVYDSSMIPNGTYYWRVGAYNISGDFSGWSNTFKFGITGPYEVPSEFPDIRSAISAIPTYNGGEVLVAPGTYTGSGNRYISGFGDKSVQVRSSGGPASTIIDCQNLGSGFNLDSHTGAGTSVEGFTIRNATGGEGGGAIECYSASVTINNCVIEYCPDGGVFIRNGARGTITNCTIKNNYWRGVSVANGSNATITGCTFIDNTTYALYLNGVDANTVVTNCDFISNQGNEGNNGYGAYVYNSAPTFQSCDFIQNEGHGLYSWNSNLSMDNCTFTGNNHYWNGGGILALNGSLITLTNSTFDDNSAQYGAGIHLEGSAVDLAQCLFDGNTASSRGGGVYVEWNATLTATGCTFVNNSADTGSAIFIQSDANAPESDGNDITGRPTQPSDKSLGGAMVSECLFAYNQQDAAVYMGYYAWIEIMCSNIYGNPGGNWTGAIAPYLGQDGNISADPLFCNAGGDDYTVTANSPCAAANNSCNTTIGAYGVGCGAIELSLTPTSFEFTAASNDPNPAAQNLQINNLGGNVLHWTLSENSSWISVNTSGGTAPSTVSISINKTGLLGGVYYDTLVVYGDNCINSPLTVPVTLTVTSGEIAVSPASLEFLAVYGTDDPLPQVLSITNTGSGIMSCLLTKTQPWLNLSAPEFTAPFDVDVSVDTTGLTPGEYHDTIVVSSEDALNSPQYVGVTFTINNVDAPTLEITASTHPVSTDDTVIVSVNTGDNLSISFAGTSPLDTIPAFSLIDKPLQSDFQDNDDGTAQFDWSPVPPLSGTHLMTVILDDGWQADSLVIGIVVNQEPSFTSTCDDVTLIEGQSYQCHLVAQDLDNPIIAITWDSVPSGATFVDHGDGTADFSFTPEYSDVDATYAPEFTVSDQLSSVADTLYIDIDNRQLTVQAMQPSPGADDDMLVTGSVQIQFNEAIDFTSVGSNLSFSSAKGTALGYSYVPSQYILLIKAVSGLLRPLDTISVTLDAGLNDLAGYTLDQTYTESFVTGSAVYPGDANDDGVVDERDILPLGLYWGNQGPDRSGAPDLDWGMSPGHIAFGGERWDPFGGAYADADGSGVVEANDICGITDNWSQTHTVSDDDKNGGASLATSLDMVEESVLQALYQAVLTCPESQGRNALRESMEALLDYQPPASSTMPTTVELYQNYPNPFNPFTTIRFYLPTNGRATLSIYNMLGQRVATLIDGHVNAGYMEATWDATDATDHAVASGIYFYRLETTDFSETRRMMLLK